MSDAPAMTLPEVLSLLRAHELGRSSCVETPFGPRLLFYADQTATGRPLRFVEDWVRRILPFYANSHTTISFTGRMMTELREDARRVVAHSVHASADDVVVFCGSGATAAIHKLVGLLGLRIPEPLERAHQLARHVPPEQRPVVFIGPYEHHSNELPWLETLADVVEIGLDARGALDLADLEARALQYAHRPLRLGTFSAASNVTGLLSDVPAIARVLHRHGAYAFFDYAAAGPYVPIDMHPADPEARIDALFLSMHKFLGGPGASGVLVANRELFRSCVPERPGGGTVDYVSAVESASVDYVHRLDEREEAGTPAILGDIRAGVAFLVKSMMGADAIRAHETQLSAQVLQRLQRNPRIRLLGSTELARLGVVSFNIVGLHHVFVSQLLDQLFGIQTRSGCACAGPYGHRLLGVDRPTSERFRALIAAGLQGIKPGWVRLSLPVYATAADLEFLLAAVELIAEHGRALLPLYRFDWHSGVWHHHAEHHRLQGQAAPPVVLSVASLLETARQPARFAAPASLDDAALAEARAGYLRDAEALMRTQAARLDAAPPAWNPPTGHAELEALRWFDYVFAEPV